MKTSVKIYADSIIACAIASNLATGNRGTFGSLIWCVEGRNTIDACETLDSAGNLVDVQESAYIRILRSHTLWCNGSRAVTITSPDGNTVTSLTTGNAWFSFSLFGEEACLGKNRSKTRNTVPVCEFHDGGLVVIEGRDYLEGAMVIRFIDSSRSQLSLQ